MNGRITVTLETSDFKQVNVSYNIDSRDWRKHGLDPLPVNHDFPLDGEAHIVAREQNRKRREFSEFLANLLSRHIVELIEKQDPIDGWFPGEPGYRVPVGRRPIMDGRENERIPLPVFDKEFERRSHQREMQDRISSFLDDSEEGKAGDQGE